MRQIFKLFQEISESEATVLIQGKSSTGKELIANFIQVTSRRKDKLFVKVNRSSLAENLLASELFGHIRGAFTNAIKVRTGRFS